MTDYDLSAVDTGIAGEKTVAVYYAFNGITKSDQFMITVTKKAKVKAQIIANSTPTQYYDKRVRLFQLLYARKSVSLRCNTSSSEMDSIKWSSDNKKVSVDESGIVTNKGWLF